MPLSRMLRLTGIYFIIIFCTSCRAADFEGGWLDNSSGVTRIGDLIISDKSISISDKISYTVELHSSDDLAAIYKVKSINKKVDPFGCGPDSKSHYIIIFLPLPDIAGTRQQAIRVLFYGLPTVPDLKEIDDNPAVCAVYSFTRKP